MIILDTNVISEALRPRPDELVRSWMDAQKPDDLFLCAPVLAELRYGIERLPASERRDELERMIATAEHDLFNDRVVPFDRTSAYEFGRIVAKRSALGRPIAPMDALVASVALSNHMSLATRDTYGFEAIGLDVINPFEPSIAPR